MRVTLQHYGTVNRQTNVSLYLYVRVHVCVCMYVRAYVYVWTLKYINKLVFFVQPSWISAKIVLHFTRAPNHKKKKKKEPWPNVCK